MLVITTEIEVDFRPYHSPPEGCTSVMFHFQVLYSISIMDGSISICRIKAKYIPMKYLLCDHVYLELKTLVPREVWN